MKGSDIKRDKSESSRHPYWTSCLMCGATATSTRPITEAHIIHGVKGHNYDYFSTASGFKDDLDVKSARNYVPLCGTYNTGDLTCCHQKFDAFKATILWNPLTQAYYLFYPQPHRDGETRHGSALTIPPQYAPYRRLLAFRAYKCGLVCHDYDMFDLPQLTLPQDNVSTAGSTSSMVGDSNSDNGTVASSCNLAGAKRGVLQTDFEEKKRKRAKRFGLHESISSWELSLQLTANKAAEDQPKKD